MCFPSLGHIQTTLLLYLWIALDRAKLQGYLRKWVDAKYLLGCDFYIDLSSPCAIFSKVMQEDDLDVLGAFTSLLCTVKEVNKLSSKPLEQWRT